MSEGSIRERLAMLSRAELVGLAAILVVTLGGAALWYSRSLPKPIQVRRAAAGGPAGTSAAAFGASPSPSVTPAPIIVDVAGAVRKPGVYEFEQGDRVIDAIQAAGGATPKASLDALNLAAPLTDGAQILVPRDVPVGAAGAGVSSSGGPAQLVNVNTAGADELEALPGIGEVIAQRIVDYRTENGPFASVDDLEDVSGIGEAILGDIRDLVTV
jgi:competence protein ComEA